MMHSSTSPLDPRVRERMLPLLEEDPAVAQGLLADGRWIRTLLEQSRGRVAEFCGADPEEIVFTSSGTESCNLALKGAALSAMSRSLPGKRILLAATEHSAVLYPGRTLGKLGFDTCLVPVNREGVVDLDALGRLAQGDTLIASVALATGETGTLQPIAPIVRLIHERGGLVHTDACLAAAHRRLDVKALGVDLASFSAHKLGGPRGVGALYVRSGVRLLPLLEGGTEEGGRRGGSPYVAGIAGFGAAAAFAVKEMPGRMARLARLGRRLEASLLEVSGVALNGHPSDRLPGVVNVSVAKVNGEALMVKLGLRGIAVSTGSSCHEEAGKPSHVLEAMGLGAERARGSILFSLGPGNTEREVDRVARAFSEAVAALRCVGATSDA